MTSTWQNGMTQQNDYIKEELLETIEYLHRTLAKLMYLHKIANFYDKTFPFINDINRDIEIIKKEILNICETRELIFKN